MAVIRLDSISYAKFIGPDIVTVQLHFLGAFFGPPMTLNSGGGFVTFPPNTTRNYFSSTTMDLYMDGNLLDEGGPVVDGTPPNTSHEYIFTCPTGTFRVNYTALPNVSNYPNAIDNYTQAIHLNPNNIIAYYNRGNALYNLGHYQSAIADYTKALKLNPNYSDIYNNRGLTRLHLGDPQGAIADYTQALKLNPNNAKVYSNRGAARNKLGDIQGALKDYNQAIRMNPDCAPAYYNRGVLRSQSGKRRAGMKDFREADALAQKQGDWVMHRQVKAVMGRK